MKNTEWLKTTDEHNLFLHRFTEPNQTPTLIVHINHGMSEHSGRYQTFAEQLLQAGIFVYAHDHRGHGKSGEAEGLLGHFSDDDGFEKAVGDIARVHQQIHKDFPGVPIVLFGHSMGSFLVRRYIQKFPKSVDGVMLSGTGAGQGTIGKVGQALAKSEAKLFGKRHKSKLMNALTFGSYQRAFKDRGSWLSRDETETDAYKQDPLCGYLSTAQFYVDLLSGIEKVHKQHQNDAMNVAIPLLIISGDEDPVGGNGDGVKKVIQHYKDAHFKDVTSHLYPGARHELLFETNRDEVISDMINWLKTKPFRQQ
ncbi:Lysophospholipase, alpha-beta hydrolase superfamily [Pelagirhabdus alkalitolerans]|uniref:Lysophospholipase, alpha-beta hydrolase superfamily n=1 Tax=Pelagirhabdus alkalitolerans TaxID=1612202 RepID=A0A1G6KVZ5_9BACI|nr:alpha/beta hydrolase [Pelagirhabdus alkalitolerans]SDC35154.1 Lysophospholipase, alpha-beta hydrolase superfamily [Pelagirhabdus alkalitolerans]